MLKEIFYGRVVPWERRNRQAGEQREIVNRIDAEESYFESILSDEDRQRFKALSSLYSQLSTASDEELFSYGFSMGLLLMADVMDEAKTMITGDLPA